MNDPDILTRLRESDGGYFMRKMFTEAADEIERLRAERDEARREVCGLLVACHTDPDDDKPDPNLKHIHAGIRGWDCFKEDKEDTDD
jgi:hypothetical protein